jgi:putative hydrolase
MSAIAFNRFAAELLRQCAELLEQQSANPFRVNAYRRAAQTLESLQEDARTIVREHGREGLMQLPFIGAGIAQAIVEIEKTGRLARLDRLRGAVEPEAQLRMVPGIGPTLARRIHESLDIDTVEALEVAAWDGRLEKLDGISGRRLAAIRAGAAGVLGRGAGRRDAESAGPPVATLLDLDAEYRRAAAAGSLPLIAPRRFNPERKRWLPVLHADREGWHFTALYSNTARARARANDGLGRPLFLRRRSPRGATHGRHRDARAAQGAACRPRRRARMRRALWFARACARGSGCK